MMTKNNLYGTPTRWQRIKETLQFATLFFFPDRGRTELVYDILSTHNHLGESSLFLNLGYWDGATTYDEACTRLAHLVGETARINSEHRILDCGFGYGDQDDYWLKTFQPAHIDAINITHKQIEIAKNRFPNKQLHFQYGSATNMSFESNSFDRVLALESPFHFHTRQDFFTEAFRVLKPGGLLVTADVIKGATVRGLKYWFAEMMGRAFWQIPKENMINSNEYSTQLTSIGFSNIQINDISPFVFDPFKAFARKRTNDPEIKKRLNPLIRMVWRTPNSGLNLFSYIIVVAVKPLDQKHPLDRKH